MQLYALLVGVVVVAVGVILVATGVFDLDVDDTDNNNPPAETAVDVAADVDADTATAAGPPTLTVALEEPFQLGDLLITVTRLRLSNSVSEDRDELIAVARFASVNLRVQNAGAAPLSLAGALQTGGRPGPRLHTQFGRLGGCGGARRQPRGRARRLLATGH